MSFPETEDPGERNALNLSAALYRHRQHDQGERCPRFRAPVRIGGLGGVAGAALGLARAGPAGPFASGDRGDDAEGCGDQPGQPVRGEKDPAVRPGRARRRGRWRS